MKQSRTNAVSALCAAGLLSLSAGCSSSGPAAQPAVSAPRCHGTIGMEVVPVTRALQKKLGLPKDAKGAIVAQVFPGGPAEAAGIRANDVVEGVGGGRVTNDCDFARVGYGRACEPVAVTVRRGGKALDLTLAPVDEGPFFDRGCLGGDLDACFRRAWLVWSRDHGDAHALDLLESACRAGSAEACAYEGLVLTGNAERGSEAVAAVERSCELRSGAGCAHLAFLYATGKIAERDDKRAAVLYEKSCDFGDAQGCYNAGLMADEGRGVPKDAARAAAKYDEGCDLGSSTACTNLGFLYENGRGVHKDAARAVTLYQRGCDGSTCQPSNLAGCVNVGRDYRDGIGVEKDETRAAGIFREACDRKVNTDDIHSAENGSRACSLLGGLYLAGDGIAKDLAQGRELSEAGCDRGDAFGCFNAAVVYGGGDGVDADPARAAHFLERACTAGDGEGCHDLAVAYAKGNGVSRDPRRSQELDRRACELGFTAACAKKKR